MVLLEKCLEALDVTCVRSVVQFEVEMGGLSNPLAASRHSVILYLPCKRRPEITVPNVVR